MRRRLTIAGTLALASLVTTALAQSGRSEFDPAFLPTGAMHIARAGHQARLLLDRRSAHRGRRPGR
jgi:hypothetical protein